VPSALVHLSALTSHHAARRSTAARNFSGGSYDLVLEPVHGEPVLRSLAGTEKYGTRQFGNAFAPPVSRIQPGYEPECATGGAIAIHA
jgi:hypothetical protein